MGPRASSSTVLEAGLDYAGDRTIETGHGAVVCGVSYIPYCRLWFITMWLRKTEGLPLPSLVHEVLWRHRDLNSRSGMNVVGWASVLCLLTVDGLSREREKQVDGD